MQGMVNIIARRAADARRRQRQPYRKLFDHIRQATRLKEPKFSARMVALLGYDYEQFKAAIVASFEPGMTWKAFVAGDLHIDHKRPLAAFDTATPDGVRAAWALSNIRASFPRDNLKKLTADLVVIRDAGMAHPDRRWRRIA